MTHQRTLSLAHLTVQDAHPLELLDAAAAGGFTAVGLRIVAPMPTDTIVPVVGDETLIAEIIRRKEHLGIAVLDTEAVWLSPDTDPLALEPALEVSHRLGATNLLVVGNDPDLNRLYDNYAELCRLAAQYELTAAVEFIPYCVTRTLDDAQALVEAAEHPNAKFLIDTLHLMRSGGSPELLSSIRADDFAYCQIADFVGPIPADVPSLRAEARTDRRYPGEGEAPLAAILDALPTGLPVGVETPVLRDARLPVVERARRCGAAVRRFFEEYDARE